MFQLESKQQEALLARQKNMLIKATQKGYELMFILDKSSCYICTERQQKPIKTSWKKKVQKTAFKAQTSQSCCSAQPQRTSQFQSSQVIFIVPF